MTSAYSVSVSSQLRINAWTVQPMYALVFVTQSSQFHQLFIPKVLVYRIYQQLGSSSKNWEEKNKHKRNLR